MNNCQQPQSKEIINLVCTVISSTSLYDYCIAVTIRLVQVYCRDVIVKIAAVCMYVCKYVCVHGIVFSHIFD